MSGESSTSFWRRSVCCENPLKVSRTKTRWEGHSKNNVKPYVARDECEKAKELFDVVALSYTPGIEATILVERHNTNRKSSSNHDGPAHAFTISNAMQYNANG